MNKQIYSLFQLQQQLTSSRLMQNIKSRNLYLPILHKTRFFQHKQTHQTINQIDTRKNDVNDLLKLLQLKKAQLQKNADNQQSDYSSDNDDTKKYQKNSHKDTHQAESNQSLNQRYNIFSVGNSKIHGFQDKIKTALDEKTQSDLNLNTQLKTKYFRVRTQHNQNSSKSTHNASQIRRKVKVIPKQNSKQLIKFLKPRQMSNQISKIVPSIPIKVKQRNQNTLKEMVDFLQEHNPFFMKMDRVVATCLLKVCKIVKKESRQTIYERQAAVNKFYVILSGRVKLSNGQIELKKVCVPGQTVLEEIMVNQSQNKQTVLALQKARSVGESYLLQISLEKLQKVKQELMKFGFKTQFHEIEALIKRNYIVKNALRVEKNKF